MSTTSSTSPVALITGGAGGIGSAIARRLSRDGITVVIAYSKSAGPAQQLVRDIEAGGQRASAVQADVTKSEAVAQLFATTLEQHGRIDYVINNAGTVVPRALPDTTDELYDLVFNVNARGALNVLRQAAKHLAAGGRIVNTSSTLVTAPIPGSGLYAASKAALELFGAVAAKELGPRGITVNSLRVGPTIPGMFSKAPPERQAAMAAASPFKRLGTPEDVADVVAFLVSDAGRWITGQTITVDGGST
jgi:3-oxoacyl-[acyl-carrier protein] reductase